MRDDDPPKCPQYRCRRKLLRIGSAPDKDGDGNETIARVLYRCPGCKRLWADNFDGKPLIYAGVDART